MITIHVSKGQSGHEETRQIPVDTDAEKFLRILYLTSQGYVWKIDYSTIPDQHYKPWMMFDYFWEFYDYLHTGYSVIIRNEIFRFEKDSGYGASLFPARCSIVYRIMGLVVGTEERTCTDHKVSIIDDSAIVVFEDIADSYPIP